MNLYLIFESIAMIFLMISIGALVSRTITFNSDTQGVFISLIVNVAMPCIILASIFTVEIDYRLINQMGIVFLSSIAIGLIGILIGFLSAHYLVKKKKRQRICHNVRLRQYGVYRHSGLCHDFRCRGCIACSCL